jgi:hypothetical protein
LADRTPETAVAAFLERLGRTLGCVVRGVAVASGAQPGRNHSVTLYVEGQTGGDPARLRTHQGDGEILLQVAQFFEVDAARDAPGSDRFSVRPTFYHFNVLDRIRNEVVVYHWEPAGLGPVRAPHLHVSAAAPIILPQRPDSGVANRKTFLNRLHLLTGSILLAMSSKS